MRNKVRQNLRVRGCSNSEPEGVVLHLFCSTCTDLGLVLGNRTVGKVQGSAQVKTLHSLGTRMTECPQQMEDKQEDRSLCCFSVGLHPMWSFEDFIQCLENPKQSSSAETALGLGVYHVDVAWAGTWAPVCTLWKSQEHAGSRARFSKGLRSAVHSRTVLLK